MKVAAIIPAYNEEERLTSVLESLKTARTPQEIIVVNDGSTDNTGAVAAAVSGVRVINLEQNQGKGGAMWAGANQTDAEIILFLDADLIGLKGEHIDSIVEPVLDGKSDMAIGVFRAGRTATDLAQKIVPYISGQRALLREHFLSMPDVCSVRSGVEVAITKYFKSRGLRVESIIIQGVTHAMKEEKMGFARGAFARLKMYRDIAKILVDGKAFTHQSRSESRKIKSREAR